MDPSNAFTPTFNHMMRILFRPFMLRKWLALGFVFILSGGTGERFSINLPSSHQNKTPDVMGSFETALEWIVAHIALIVIGVLFLFLLSIFLQWLFSVMRFVYINQITRSPAEIREPFARLSHLGTSFFLWELAFGACVMLALGLIVVLPIVLAVAAGNTGDKIGAVAWGLLTGIPLIIAAVIAGIFAQDFVVPAMFVRNVGVIEGWRIVLPILKANLVQSILYLLFLMVIGLGVGIFGLLAMLATTLIFAIPAGLLALIGWGIWNASGAYWSPVLIAYTSVFGSVLLLAIIYVMSCMMQPAAVFRRTYSLVVLGQAEPTLATIP